MIPGAYVTTPSPSRTTALAGATPHSAMHSTPAACARARGGRASIVTDARGVVMRDRYSSARDAAAAGVRADDDDVDDADDDADEAWDTASFACATMDDYMAITTRATTGHCLWNAARALCAFLERDASARAAIDRAGVRVLELGSGVGWLAFAVAMNARDAGAVRATETAQGGALTWLELNIERNVARLSGGNVEKLGRLSCGEFDWDAFDDDDVTVGEGSFAADDFDVVLGSDLVYDESGTHMLPKVLFGVLRKPHAMCYYAHTKHRYDSLDLDFFEQLDLRGLAIEEMRQPGVLETPPPSPPPFESLFPDQRIAVYKITRRTNG
jgi:predicted nicotinamide N-methyase